MTNFPDFQNGEVHLVLPSLNLAEIERSAIVLAMAQHKGNRTHAAEALGIDIRTLQRKLKAFGMQDQPPNTANYRNSL